MKLIKENIPFTMVANEVLYNKNLSFKTKGLYAYLFSKPDTWDFSSSRMVLETKDSRDSIMVMLRELEEAGYLIRKRLSTGKVEYTLIFSHNSLSREMPLGVEKPKSEIAYVAKSLRGESLPISNIEEKVISKDIVIKKEEKVLCLKLSEFNNVSILEEEKAKLIERFGEKNTSVLIEELGTYLASTGKRYSSHYATLLNWGKRKIADYQKKHNQPSKYQAGSINIE